MKHTFFLLCFVSFFNSHTSFAMDKEEFTDIALEPLKKSPAIKQTRATSESIEAACKAIDSKYKGFLGVWTPLDDDEKFDVITIASSHCGNNMDQETIKQLFEANSFFDNAINYYSDLFYESCKKVTLETIDIIADYIKEPKETFFGDKVPVAIQRYIINWVCKDELIPERPGKLCLDSVNQHDICPSANLAATANYQDGTFRLWDLATGKNTFTLPEKAFTGSGTIFNSDGSKLLTASYDETQNINYAKIWCTKTAKLLHTLQLPDRATQIRNVVFHQNEHSNQLLASTTRDYLLIYNLSDKKPHLLCYIPHIKITYPQRDLRPYSINYSNNKLQITKNENHLLYLCECALNNTLDTKSRIKNTSTYQSLAPYEQKRINEKIRQTSSGGRTIQSRGW